jgi:hypothetical protein
MNRALHRCLAVAVVAVAALSLGACGGGGDGAEEDSGSNAATVQPIEGSELSRVTLTDEAAHRIDLQTEAVALEGEGPGTHVPYGAVLYDPQGRTWAFVNVDGLTFVREPINVAKIDHGVVSLTAGPAAGTKVVTVGAPELYGAEIGVGDE